MSEIDLSIVSALQESPRAAWTDIARVLQIGAETLTQRWQHLSSAGLAWIAVDEVHPGRRALTFVLVNAPGNARAQLLDGALEDPRIRTVHATTGSRAFCLYIETDTYDDTARCIEQRVDSVRGITDRMVLPVVEVVSSGADWRTRALDATQRHALEAFRRPARQSTRPLAPTDSVVSSLQAELSIDGRASIAELTARLRTHHHLDVSESTVARRLTRMLDDPLYRIRCDVSPEHLGWHAVTMLWLRVPPGLANKLCRDSASTRHRIKTELPDVRSFMITLGPTNLHVTAWLHRVQDVPAFEADLIRWLEGSGEIMERAMCHTTNKRMGFSIENGKRTNQRSAP
ncbi:MAG: Lrp/AsnC family transcriptional regulator [Rhodococcus sp. (in: high G+C Gram-positive bacteria)]|nr:Lrp/AsnC family transcriptional regulator [Rhodococcus sp. (in: high G+C Gram-positive bacteria)]